MEGLLLWTIIQCRFSVVIALSVQLLPATVLGGVLV